MKKFTTILVLVLLTFAFGKNSFAYSSSPSLPSPSPANSLNRLSDPLDYLNEITKKLPGFKDIGTTLPIPQQFSMQNLGISGLSFNDLPGALKAIAVLAINLFLIVIQTTASILKALFPFFI